MITCDFSVDMGAWMGYNVFISIRESEVKKMKNLPLVLNLLASCINCITIGLIVKQVRSK
jgi:hypothetical protein